MKKSVKVEVVVADVVVVWAPCMVMVVMAVMVVDMVSSTLLTICQTYKIKAGSILAVSDNVVTGEMGFMNPLYYMAESNLIKIALEAVKKMEAKL